MRDLSCDVNCAR